MLSRGAIVVLAGGASLVCAACDGIPGSEAFREGKVKRAVAEQLIDPASAQFRNVQTRGNSVCGEVNAKNRMGAYVGFTRFIVDVGTYNARLDPQFDVTDLFTARDLCRELTSNAYSSAGTVVQACNRAAELEVQNSNQQRFDAQWERSCSGDAAREVYRPPLASEPSADDANISTDLVDTNLAAATVPEDDAAPAAPDAEDAAATERVVDSEGNLVTELNDAIEDNSQGEPEQ